MAIRRSPVLRIHQETKRGLWVFRHHMKEVMRHPHVHDQVEVLVVERGWIQHRQCGQEVRLEPGHLIAFWSAFPHHTVDMDPDTDLLLMYLPLDFFLRQADANPLVGHWLSRQALHDLDAVTNLAWARSCLALGSQQTPLAQRLLHLRLETRLMEIALKQDVNLPTVVAATRSSHHTIAGIIQVVLERFRESLSVPELAKQAGIHPDYAVRLFKRVVGLSLWEFVLQVRVAHSQHLLNDSDTTVLDAGLAAGFASASSFHAAFRRIVGITPDLYRRNASHQNQLDTRKR